MKENRDDWVVVEFDDLGGKLERGLLGNLLLCLGCSSGWVDLSVAFP
jgi:hypothetical protein